MLIKHGLVAALPSSKFMEQFIFPLMDSSGLDRSLVTAIDIHIAVECVITLTVEMLVREPEYGEDTGNIEAIKNRYYLVEADDDG